MKIPLISPPFTRYGGVEGHGGGVAPLNLGYLASHIRRARPAVEIGILDAEVFDYDFEQIENVIRQMKPTLVGITSPAPAFFECFEIARRVKKVGQSIRTVMGGPHPSSSTKEVVAQADVDLAILMEGEDTFLEVTNILIEGGGFDGVLGLAFMDANGEPKVNPPRPLIEDLDTIPFPACDLLPLSRYFRSPTKRVSGGRSANMITT